MIYEKTSFLGTGRRKRAIAQVELVPGTGKMTVNGKEGIVYMQFNPTAIFAIQGPLNTLGLEDSYDTIVKTKGGGLIGQAEAIKLGVARALCKIDSTKRSVLKSSRYLTRNSLIKERKKYGLKKARKAPQFSKR